MPNGLTEQQMVGRMYTELVGLDGNSGLIKEHRELRADVRNLQSMAVTHEQCAARHRAGGERRNKIIMRVKDGALLLVAILALLLGSGILKGG